MKKIFISILVVVALFAMQLPTTIFAATDETTSFLLDENFEAWDGTESGLESPATNINFIVPSSGASSDSAIKGNTDKTMKLSVDTTTDSPSNRQLQILPYNKSGYIYPTSSFVFSTDVYLSDYSTDVRIYYYGQDKTGELSSNPYRGTLLLFDNNPIDDKYYIKGYKNNDAHNLMTYEKEKWYHVDIVVTALESTYKYVAYIDGVKFDVDGFPNERNSANLGNMKLSYLEVTVLAAGASETNATYIDNLYFTYLNNISQSRYTAESSIVDRSGKIGYSTTFDVTVKFVDAIDIATYEDGKITLTGGEAPLVLSPVWDSDARGFTVNVPAYSLEASTEYTLNIDGVNDVYGNALISSISFETASTPIDFKQAPSIEISADSVASRGDSVDISADIEVNDGGSITKVEYYDNGEKIGESTLSPFGYTIESITAGVHSITAVVCSSEGLSSESSEVVINVDDNLVTTISPTFSGDATISTIPVNGKISYTLSDSEKAQVANGANILFEIDIDVPSSRPYLFMGFNGAAENSCFALYKGSNFKVRTNSSTSDWNASGDLGGFYSTDTRVKIVGSVNYYKGTYSLECFKNNNANSYVSGTYSLGEKFKDNAKLSLITDISSLDFVVTQNPVNTIHSVSVKVVAPRPTISGIVYKDSANNIQTTNAGNVSKNADKIEVAFSEDMSEESFTNESVTLIDSKGNPVPFEKDYDKSNKILVLDLKEVLEFGETYTLTLNNTIKSTMLVSMSDTKIVSFSTPENKFEITGTPSISSKQVSFAGEFMNNSALAQDVLVVLAAYDSENKLIGVTFDTKNVSSGGKWDNIALLFVAEETPHHVRTFVWDSFTKMIPLIPAE